MGRSRYRREAVAVNRLPPQPAAGKTLTNHGSPRPCGVARTPTGLCIAPGPPALSCTPPAGRSPHIPRRAVKEATAQVPSPAVWSPGRRGAIPAAAPTSSSPAGVGQNVHNRSRRLDMPDGPDIRMCVYHPSNSSRSHALCEHRRSVWGGVVFVGISEGSFLEGPNTLRHPKIPVYAGGLQ